MRVFGTVTALLVIGAALVDRLPQATVRDRWYDPARGIRYLHRHRDDPHDPEDIHVAFVDLRTRGLRLRVTTPEERGERPSAWAQRVGAVLAVNGDYFDGPTMMPLGPSRGAGQWWPAGPRLHRDALFASSPDGAVTLFDSLAPGEQLWTDAPQRVGDRWSDVLGVRERILVAGRPRLSPNIVHDGGRHPRTALGLTEDRSRLIVLVVDGRAEDAAGATVGELSAMLRSFGAWDGMKLDGGGSSTMYFAGMGVVNHPSDGHERAVANHLGVLEPGS